MSASKTTSVRCQSEADKASICAMFFRCCWRSLGETERLLSLSAEASWCRRTPTMNPPVFCWSGLDDKVRCQQSAQSGVGDKKLASMAMVNFCQSVVFASSSCRIRSLSCLKSSLLAVFLTNLFLGWTFLGWVAALVWSAMPVKTNVTA